jgi:hypothetical protein
MEPDKWDPHVTNPLLSLFLPQRVSLPLAARPVGAEEAPVAVRPAGGGGAPTVVGVEVVADGRGGSGRGGGGRGWQTCSMSDPHRRRVGARARALGGGQGKVTPLALAVTRGAPTPCRAAREPGHATRGPVLPSSCLGRTAWGPRLLPAASSTGRRLHPSRLLHRPPPPPSASSTPATVGAPPPQLDAQPPKLPSPLLDAPSEEKRW